MFYKICAFVGKKVPYFLLQDLKVVGTAQTKNSALAVENKGKNRYNNVLPCKHKPVNVITFITIRSASTSSRSRCIRVYRYKRKKVLKPA